MQDTRVAGAVGRCARGRESVRKVWQYILPAVTVMKINSLGMLCRYITAL
jgi:hypothetical protein